MAHVRQRLSHAQSLPNTPASPTPGTPSGKPIDGSPSIQTRTTRTPEQLARLEMIRMPFQTRRIPGKSWGGVNVGNAGSVPSEGHRTWQLSAEDESYLRYGQFDDERQGED